MLLIRLTLMMTLLTITSTDIIIIIIMHYNIYIYIYIYIYYYYIYTIILSNIMPILLLLLFHSLRVFHGSVNFFPWGLSDSKSLRLLKTSQHCCQFQLWRGLYGLGIFFGFPIPLVYFTNPWRLLLYYCFLNSLARSKYLSVFSFSFLFTLWSTRISKSTKWQLLSFCWLRLAQAFWSELSDPLVSQNRKNLCYIMSDGRWCCLV